MRLCFYINGTEKVFPAGYLNIIFFQMWLLCQQFEPVKKINFVEVTVTSSRTWNYSSIWPIISWGSGGPQQCRASKSLGHQTPPKLKPQYWSWSIFIVFGMTQPRFEPATKQSQGGQPIRPLSWYRLLFHHLSLQSWLNLLIEVPRSKTETKPRKMPESETSSKQKNFVIQSNTHLHYENTGRSVHLTIQTTCCAPEPSRLKPIMQLCTHPACHFLLAIISYKHSAAPAFWKQCCRLARVAATLPIGLSAVQWTLWHIKYIVITKE